MVEGNSEAILSSRVASQVSSLAHYKASDLRKHAKEILPHGVDTLSLLMRYTEKLESDYAASLIKIHQLEDQVRDLQEQMALYSLEARQIERMVSYSDEANVQTRMSVNSDDSGEWKWNESFSEEYALKRSSEEDERKIVSPPGKSYLSALTASGRPRNSSLEIIDDRSFFVNNEFDEYDVFDSEKRGVLNFFLRRNGWYNYRPGDVVMRCRITGSSDLEEVKRIMPNLKVGTEKNNKLVKAHLSIGGGRVLDKMAQVKKGALSSLR